MSVIDYATSRTPQRDRHSWLFAFVLVAVFAAGGALAGHLLYERSIFDLTRGNQVFTVGVSDDFKYSRFVGLCGVAGAVVASGALAARRLARGKDAIRWSLVLFALFTAGALGGRCYARVIYDPTRLSLPPIVTQNGTTAYTMPYLTLGSVPIWIAPVAGMATVLVALALLGAWRLSHWRGQVQA